MAGYQSSHATSGLNLRYHPRYTNTMATVALRRPRRRHHRHGAPERVAITIPAGTFDDCRLESESGGLGDGSTVAICRGIGYVERDAYWRQNSPPFQGSRSVTQRESYDVVLPR